jgi:hypothetical protein
MKKKLILSIICTALLSFGAMAKSSVKTIKCRTLYTKSVHHRQSKQSTKVFSCIPVTLSCGIRGWACGETVREAIDNAIWADGVLCP